MESPGSEADGFWLPSSPLPRLLKGFEAISLTPLRLLVRCMPRLATYLFFYQPGSNDEYHNFPTHPPLLWPQYDMFSGAVHLNRPCEALKICHTGRSVVGVVILVLK